MAQCIAKTQDGKPCQIPTRAGQRYCHVHRRQRLWRLTLSFSFLGASVLAILSFVTDITGLLSFVGVNPGPTSIVQVHITVNSATEQPSTTLLPQVSSTEPFASLLDLIAEGDTSMTEKDYRKAIEYYQRALNIDPRDSETLRKTGEAYIGLAMNETSFRYVMDHALNADENLFKQALPYFDKAIKINPQDKDAYIFRGIVWYRLGNLHPIYGPTNNDQNASSQYTYALQLELDTPNIPPEVWNHQSACAYYGIAKVYERMNTEEIYGGGNNQYYKKQVEEYMEKGDGC